MANDGKLRLALQDVYGQPIGEKVDIDFRHMTLSDHRVVRGVNSTKRIVVDGLTSTPQGLYRVMIDPPGYLPVGKFVRLKPSGITDEVFTFPIDPRKVVGVKFPDYETLFDCQALIEESCTVLGFEGKKGPDLYGGMDDIRRAGFLNIIAKTRATPLTSGKSVLHYIQCLHELRGDRFFATVPKTLREEVKNSVSADLFHEANQSMHHPPVGFVGFSNAGSFKTNDQHGNLQLSFFMKGDDCLVDIDIDDAAGLGHIFQVVRNELSGRPTHPFDIHQILVFRQKVDPGYRLQV